MSEAKVYTVDFRQLFREQEKFLDFIKSITRNALWERRKSKALRLVAFKRDSRIEQELRQQYADEGMDEGIL